MAMAFRGTGFEYKSDEVLYLSACRATKFSLHVMFPTLELDRGYLSCRTLAWEFSRYLWRVVGARLKTAWLDRANPNRPDYFLVCALRMSLLHKQADENNDWYTLYDTMVDEVIYTKNRQFRLVGNGKHNGVPLVIVRSSVECRDLFLAGGGTSLEQLGRLSLHDFCNLMVVPVIRHPLDAQKTYVIKARVQFPFRVEVERRRLACFSLEHLAWLGDPLVLGAIPAVGLEDVLFVEDRIGKRIVLANTNRER